jgi:hypothetical protein
MSRDDGLRMPWSGWIVVIALLASLNSFGSFMIIILLVYPVVKINYFSHENPAVTLAIAALDIKARYVWPMALVVGLGLLFAVLARRNPQRRVYMHAAILLLGFLLAGAISVRNLSELADAYTREVAGDRR